MKKYSNKQSIKVGVIGYGGAFNMGKTHLSQMATAGMTPTAVTEIDSERLKVAATDFPGIEMYSSIDDMLEKSSVDLITIITPHNTHADLALRCLKAGRHVVCEKPLAITLDEVDAMIEAARRSGLVLSTFHNRHWDGCILEAVDQIKERQIIGDIFRIEAHMGGYGNPGDWWRSSKSISGGIHYDWGVHLLEYALQIIDSRLIEVSGFAKSGFWETRWGADTNEDELTAIARFENGTLLNLRITTLDAHPDTDDLVFTGTKGKYRFNQKGFSHFRRDEKGSHRTDGVNRPGTHHKYYENIADVLIGEAELIITPEWSRKPIEILYLASQSAKQGRAILA